MLSNESPNIILSRRYRLIVGAMVGFSAIAALNYAGVDLNDGWWLLIGLVIGAAVIGYFLAGGFGRRGTRGWIMAVLTYLGCTIAGGAIGGFILGLFGGGPGGPMGSLVLGAIFALIVVFTDLSSLIWFASLFVIQLVAMRFRRFDYVVEPDIAKRFE